MFVRNDSRTFIFCRSKCKRHFKARHHPRQSKWTKACRAARGKELVDDPVFAFEKRRNRPVKYDRDLYIKTVQAMTILDRIRQKRRLRFYLMRIRRVQDQVLGSKAQHVLPDKQSIRMTSLAAKRRAIALNPTKVQRDPIAEALQSRLL